VRAARLAAVLILGLAAVAAAIAPRQGPALVGYEDLESEADALAALQVDRR
jgi:hypothetical protein